jgi:anti-sigma factor RsiW
MAKPLGAKSLLIREAIKAHPDKGNTELADMINGSDARQHDKLKVTAQDIASQKQAMKKAAAAAPATAPERAPTKPARKKPGRKPGSKPAPKQAASAPAVAQPAPIATADVFAHMEAIKAAVKQLGADQVRRIVGLFE